MADKFLHELGAVETLSNEDLLLISKKDNEGNYTTEYTEVCTLTTLVSNELSSDLENHINEKDTTDKLHITKDERDTWNEAATSINDFLTGAETANETIDRLKEIQTWFANNDNKNAADILGAISNLETTLAELQTAFGELQEENTNLKNKLAAYDTRFGYTEDKDKNVSWTVNFLKINSPAKS